MRRVSHLAIAVALGVASSGVSADPFANVTLSRHLARMSATCSLENGVDYIGNDLGNVPSAQAQDCCSKCAATPNCGAFTWTGYQGGTCWLKSGKGATKANDGVQSAEVIPDPNGSCNLEQNVDIVGNDLGNVPGSAAGDCCAKCDQVSGCVAFTWSNYNGGTCWLKNGRSNTKTTSGVVSATVVRPTKCTATEQGVDYTGADIGNVASSTADGCCAKCSQNSNCGAFTWTGYNGGTCWLKRERGGTKPNSGATSGTVAVQSKCLAIEENVDYSGADIGNEQSPSAEGCCAKCSTKYGCKAFTWTNFNGGTCWYKSDKGTSKSNPGAKSGTVVNTAGEHIQYRMRRNEVPLRAVSLGSWLVGEHWQSYTSPMWWGSDQGENGEFVTMKGLGHGHDWQFEQHRQTWITEADIQKIAGYGLNAVRVPVGYWIVNGDPSATIRPWQSHVFAPGALKYLDKLINEWALKYNIAVMLSLHAHIGSQNGYDHSAPEWKGQIQWSNSEDNKINSLQFATVLARRYKNSPAFLGMNLMNEPVWQINQGFLQDYYIRAYNAIRGDGNDCILVVSPYIGNQGPEMYQDFMRWPKYTNVWVEWHVYFNDWVYPNSNKDQIIQTVWDYKHSHFDQWNGNYIFEGEWNLDHGPKADFNNDWNAWRNFGKTQMEVYRSAHGGWSYWTWRHDNERNGYTGWSMRQMLDNGILQGPFT